MAELISPRLATPSCAKPFTCPPLSLGAGANLSSPGLLCWRGANCPISPFEAPLCVNSFTSPLASSNTKQHSTLHWSFCPKLFDFQDPIYRAEVRLSLICVNLRSSAVGMGASVASFLDFGHDLQPE